jgi:hypothetical protein
VEKRGRWGQRKMKRLDPSFTRMNVDHLLFMSGGLTLGQSWVDTRVYSFFNFLRGGLFSR